MALSEVPHSRRDSDWGDASLAVRRCVRAEVMGRVEGRELAAAGSRGVAGGELSASQADLGELPHANMRPCLLSPPAKKGKFLS